MLTRLHRAVDVRAALVVHPVESRLDRQPGEHAVLAVVAIRCGDVDGPALVVQRVDAVVHVLVPGFGDTQPDARPLVHHGHGQRVEFLLAALCVVEGNDERIRVSQLP